MLLYIALLFIYSQALLESIDIIIEGSYCRRMKRKEKTLTLTRTMTVKLTDRSCPTCGKKFEGWGKQQYCSKLCSNRAAYARHAEQYRAARRAKYQAEKKTAGTQ
jgi:tRNA(Ile2) C34 agmatinyltransferase TiaS